MELNKENFDAIIIGSGIGGLVTASQLAAKGARVLVLEKYIDKLTDRFPNEKKGIKKFYDTFESVC